MDQYHGYFLSVDFENEINQIILLECERNENIFFHLKYIESEHEG